MYPSDEMTIQEAIKVYWDHALVHYESCQRQAEVAWRVLAKHLDNDTLREIRTAELHAEDGPSGKARWEFDAAMGRVFRLFNPGA